MLSTKSLYLFVDVCLFFFVNTITITCKRLNIMMKFGEYVCCTKFIAEFEFQGHRPHFWRSLSRKCGKAII